MERLDIKKIGITEKRTCQGHFGKIYALHWGDDSNYIVTASQDGKLIIWNAFTGNKQLAITLKSSWVMTCAFSPSYSFIASGGLDNIVSVFRVSAGNEQKFREKELYCELEKHDGYLSCARFVAEGEILSASGDGSLILWDAESKQPKSCFVDHAEDVMYCSINETNPNLFVSGSVDCTAKVFDYRKGESSIANFTGHNQDVNTVEWFPDGYGIITGSDDGLVRLFDMRSMRQLNSYVNLENRSIHVEDLAAVTSVSVSKSGQYIFSSYDNKHVYCWDVLTAQHMSDFEHANRVSTLSVAPNGFALATGCWDFNLRIFA